MLPLALFAVGQAMAVLQNVMGGVSTADYRKKVLSALKQMQDTLERILTEINELMAEGELYAMRQAMKEADSDINTWYNRPEFQAFLAGTREDIPSDLADSIKANVKDHLTRLHEAMIGQGLESVTAPWLKLWVDAYRGRTSTSAIEAAFQVFYGYMLPVQLRGLALLSAVKDVDVWGDQLKANFKQQGEVCQGVIDQLPNSDHWTGVDASAADVYDSKIVQKGEWAGVPDQNVVVACKFTVNAEGDLLFKVFYAPLLPLPSVGFVDTTKITYTYTRGERHDFDIYHRQEDHGAYHQDARMYVDHSYLEVPQGNAIVDIMVNFYGSDTTTGANELKIGQMGMTIKYRPVNADNSLGDPSTLSTPGGDDAWSQLGKAEFATWFLSPENNGESPAGQTWNTPMTGIRLTTDDDGRARLYCAYTVHQQSYGTPGKD